MIETGESANMVCQPVARLFGGESLKLRWRLVQLAKIVALLRRGA